MLRALRSQFQGQLDEILTNADRTRISKSYVKKDWLADLIEWTKATNNLRISLAPVLYPLIVETGQDAMNALGFDPSQFNPANVDTLNYYQHRAAKIASDVDQETEKQLRASLSQGIDANESQPQLRARIESVMGAALTYRAQRIAQTEVTRAQSFGDIQAWNQSGVVEGKEWYTAHDEHVCKWCSAVDERVIALNANFFDKGEVFDAEGKTMAINYDDIPGCPLHVNCRCTLLPVRIQ